LSLAVYVALLSALCLFSLSAQSREPQDICDREAGARFQTAEVFVGTTQWQINEFGDLIVGVDTDFSDGPDIAYRFRTASPGELRRITQNWPAGESPASSIRATSVRTDYVEIEFSDIRQKFIFFTNPVGCKNLDYPPFAIELSALGFNVFSDSLEQTQEEFETLASQSLVRQEPEGRKNSDASTQGTVMVCIAGGEGASGCSYSMGGISPFSSGSCSIDCLDPNEYACCGPGFLKNCDCIPYDDGNDGGSGGFWSPFFPGPPGDDDDDEDDDDDGDEDPFGIH